MKMLAKHDKGVTTCAIAFRLAEWLSTAKKINFGPCALFPKFSNPREGRSKLETTLLKLFAGIRHNLGKRAYREEPNPNAASS